MIFGMSQCLAYPMELPKQPVPNGEINNSKRHYNAWQSTISSISNSHSCTWTVWAAEKIIYAFKVYGWVTKCFIFFQKRSKKRGTTFLRNLNFVSLFHYYSSTSWKTMTFPILKRETIVHRALGEKFENWYLFSDFIWNHRCVMENCPDFYWHNFGRRKVQLQATGNLCAPGLSAFLVFDYPRRSPEGTGELIWWTHMGDFYP